MKEIRSAENVKNWKVEKCTDISQITFYDSNGEEMASTFKEKKKDKKCEKPHKKPEKKKK